MFGLGRGFSHTVEVTGSNPVPPIQLNSWIIRIYGKKRLETISGWRSLETVVETIGKVSTAR
jgi:hypothetical protein